MSGDYLTTTATGTFSTEMCFDLDALTRLMDSMPKPPEPPKIAYVHPNNAEHFRKYPVAEAMIVDDLVPEFAQPHWEPGSWGKFVTLEKSDEPWARPMGLGRMVDSKERIAFLVDQAMLRLQDEIVREPKPGFMFMGMPRFSHPMPVTLGYS
jgi:hypothetical protein